jgi:predicted TIM-barrel fold metal-dependent hydrolase
MEKKYTVIDTEFHHVPWEAAQRARDLPGPGPYGESKFSAIIDNMDSTYSKFFDVKACLQHMENCGVDMTLIGQATWTIASLEVCRIINDELAREAAAHPGKFIPMAHVPPLDGQPALDELERAVNELGMKAIAVTTSQQQGATIDDERMKPFFKKASQLNVPVVVHPSVKMPIWGGTKYFMSGSVSREYDIVKSLVEVLCGVLPEFPNLRFLFSHYGGGAPFLLGRIMSWYAPPDSAVPKELVGKPKTYAEFLECGLKERFDALLDRIYFNTAGTGGWLPALKQALLVISPERICFGSDYPFELARVADYRGFISDVMSLDVPEHVAAGIFGGNAKRLFNV